MNMEPPDARAGARRAPRLLVLALLLAAPPGMARAESRARLGGAGRGGEGRWERAFTDPRDPRKGGIWGTTPSERSSDSQAEGWGSSAVY